MVSDRRVVQARPHALRAQALEHMARVEALVGPLRRPRYAELPVGPAREATATHPEAARHLRAAESAWWELALTARHAMVWAARRTERVAPEHVMPGDLEGAAWEGVYRAAMTWDPAEGPWHPYAAMSAYGWARKEMSRGRMGTSNAQYRAWVLRRWLDEGLPLPEAAERCGLTVAQAADVLGATGGAVSLDQPVGEGSARLGDMLGEEDPDRTEVLDLERLASQLEPARVQWLAAVSQGAPVIETGTALGFGCRETARAQWGRTLDGLRKRAGLVSTHRATRREVRDALVQWGPISSADLARKLGAEMVHLQRLVAGLHHLHKQGKPGGVRLVNGNKWEVVRG